MASLIETLGVFSHPENRLFLETPEGRRITYGELKALTGRYANALLGLGVRPGDRVAVQVEKSPEALALYLATVRAGAVFLPLNTTYTLNELDHFLGDAQPALAVVRPDRVDGVEGLGKGRVVSLGDDGQSGTLHDLARSASPDFQDVPRAGSDLAAILYTSGTTGRSKGAMLSHDNLASNALTLADAWRFSAADVLLHALPVYHTHGLFVATNTVLAAGASLLFLPAFEAKTVLSLLPRATVMMGVPTYYTRLLDEPGLDRASTANIRLFVSGSAPLLAATHADWSARTGHAILERYGMTETNMITSNPYEGPRIAGSVGPALPGVSVRIADPETGAHLPDGQVGMIEVKGPNVFSGYWRMPEKTAQEFRADGFFVTGDLGVKDANGYVSIVGRGKDLIITGGLNVYPKEVEAEIDALPGVVESAVIGLPHRDFGEAVTAVVAAPSGVDPEAVLAALRERLAGFKLPKRVIVVEALPRNAMGKVQKAKLRETYAALYDA